MIKVFLILYFGLYSVKHYCNGTERLLKLVSGIFSPKQCHILYLPTSSKSLHEIFDLGVQGFWKKTPAYPRTLFTSKHNTVSLELFSLKNGELGQVYHLSFTQIKVSIFLEHLSVKAVSRWDFGSATIGIGMRKRVACIYMWEIILMEVSYKLQRMPFVLKWGEGGGWRMQRGWGVLPNRSLPGWVLYLPLQNVQQGKWLAAECDSFLNLIKFI